MPGTLWCHSRISAQAPWRSPFIFGLIRRVRPPVNGPHSKELKRRYETLWPVIAETMVKCHPRLSSVDRCREYVDPTVGCYIQNKASRGHDDFELVYELRDEPGRGIFVRIAGWDVVESAVAK